MYRVAVWTLKRTCLLQDLHINRAKRVCTHNQTCSKIMRHFKNYTGKGISTTAWTVKLAQCLHLHLNAPLKDFTQIYKNNLYRFCLLKVHTQHWFSDSKHK